MLLLKRMNKICLVGDILVDITLRNKKEDLKMRLGGIAHSARCLWAINNDYEIAYISPSYLDSKVNDFFEHHGQPKIFKAAETLNAPNLILIEEAREVGNQGYDLILREENEYKYNDIDFNQFERLLMITGQYDCKKVLEKIDGLKVSIELANVTFEQFIELDYKFKNIYISTSSEIFKLFIKDKDFNFDDFVILFKGHCENIIFKENRGGTRVYNFAEDKLYQVGAQTRPILHSVGVGDVFNSVFESNIHNDIQKNLSLASFIALEYAMTTYPVNFKDSVERLLKVDINDLVNLKGVVLNWEKRNSINIYIAAPDFDFVDTSLIDTLEQSLLYHNFKPRRPVRENGQMKENDSEDKKMNFYSNDLKILDESKILIAVLLYNDPGTLVEIGIASERKIPVLLYDPYNIAKNCMLTHSCMVVTDNLDDIISEVFSIGSKL